MGRALLLSLQVLACTIPLIVLLGGWAGWILARKEFPGKTFFSLLAQLPLILPPSVMGFYLLFFLGKTPWLRELGLLLSRPGNDGGGLGQPHHDPGGPGGLRLRGPDLEDVGRTLGKGEGRIFLSITSSLARRTLLVGVALSAARALGDFGVSLMVAGNMPGRTQTLPLYIYNQVETLSFGRANLAALLLVGAGFASLLFVRSLESGRNESHASR
ncbi:ABC transporter permease subunit [Aminivibrio sp.]